MKGRPDPVATAARQLVKLLLRQVREDRTPAVIAELRCRQLQCRMQRCGQFWTQPGDDALPTLGTFLGNGDWEKLFLHAERTSVS